MTKIETIAKWLKEPESKKILAPKTLTSCVYDANGNKVEAGEFLFQAVNYGSLRNYKYSISVVPWTKPEIT